MLQVERYKRGAVNNGVWPCQMETLAKSGDLPKLNDNKIQPEARYVARVGLKQSSSLCLLNAFTDLKTNIFI